MRAIYQPIGFLWWSPDPIECELIEWIDEPGAIKRARIRYAPAENSILGIATRAQGRTTPMPLEERVVLAFCVHVVQ